MNAYIIHKEKHTNPVSHYKFREKLALSLSKRSCLPSDLDSTEDDSDSDSDLLLSEQQHVFMEKREQCAYCKIAHKEVHYTVRQCQECMAPLCFRDRICFVKWHDSTFSASRQAWKEEQMSLLPKSGRPLGSTVTKGRGSEKGRDGDAADLRTWFYLHFLILIVNFTCIQFIFACIQIMACMFSIDA